MVCTQEEPLEAKRRIRLLEIALALIERELE